MTAGLVLLAAAAGAAEAPDALGTLLAKADLDGWQQAGKPETYNPDDVFKLIDGEAELYFPYGFKRVAAVNYQKPGLDVPFAVEAYEMGSTLDAFGIYSNYRDTDSKLIGVGTEGYLGRGQAVFYQDTCFVKVRAQKSDVKPEDVESLAKAISAALPQNKAKPEELKALAIPQVVPQSEQYIGQSLLGHKFLTRGLVAQVKVDDKTARVFVAMPARNGKENLLEGYAAYLEKNGAKMTRIDDNTSAFVDPLQKGTIIRKKGDCLLGVTGLAAPEAGLPLLEALEKAG